MEGGGNSIRSPSLCRPLLPLGFAKTCRRQKLVFLTASSIKELSVPRCCSAEPLANFYITNITDSWVPFTGVIEMSALVDRNQFNGNALIYLPKYVACDSPAFDIPDGVLKERFVAALERMYPTFKRRTLLSFKVSRVRYLLPISTLNYSQRVPPVATSIPGVYLVNSAHIMNGTLNVNETIQVAERAAAQFALESAMNFSTRGERETQVYEADRKSVVRS